MKVVLIRHGKTSGNLRGAYVGRSDEPLIDTVINKSFPLVSVLYSSPMLRCLQTSALIYPHMTPEVKTDLRECDFGDFEGKCYEELKENAEYVSWCESSGRLAFPNGESGISFRKRCVKAFENIISSHKDKVQSIAIICHGGTIMSILEYYSEENQDFYSFQVENLKGYIFDFDGKTISNLEKI